MTSAAYVRKYVAGHENARRILGEGPADKWEIDEIGDGNINFVFRVKNPQTGHSLCFKRALPYIRVVPSAKLSAARLRYEAIYLQEAGRWCGNRVPKVVHCDPEEGVLIMSWLTPHLILKTGGFVRGETDFSSFPLHIGEYLATLFFHTSDVGATPSERAQLFKSFSPDNNAEMVALTGDVIFTTPFQRRPKDAFPNNYQKPFLDAIVESVQNDIDLKRCIVALKHKFKTSNEALLHGDLHTGSVMATRDDTKVIDAEFACLGPIGFDIGLVFAHLFLAAFSLRARSLKLKSTTKGDEVPKDRCFHALDMVQMSWHHFQKKLSTLLKSDRGKSSEYFGICETQEEREVATTALFRRLFLESCGFAGVAMLRRVIGVVSTEDLTSIKDPAIRAACEADVVRFGRMLILESGGTRAQKDQEFDLANMVKRARFLLHAKGATRVPFAPFEPLPIPWSNLLLVRGDLLEAGEQYIVHQTNCRTNYALGLAKHIFKKWPHADCYSERKPWVKGKVYSTPGTIDVRKQRRPGSLDTSDESRGVINLFGQDMPGTIEKELRGKIVGKKKRAAASKEQRRLWFASAVRDIATKIPGIKSVAFPFEIGCGLAGGDWAVYYDLIRDLAARRKDVRVVIYRLPDAKAAAFKKEVAHDKKHASKEKRQFKECIEAAFGGRHGESDNDGGGGEKRSGSDEKQIGKEPSHRGWEKKK
eukprot:g1785.t1